MFKQNDDVWFSSQGNKFLFKLIFSLIKEKAIYIINISQQEWGTSCPHEFEGAFRLEHDQSWTPSEKFEQRENDQQLINKILSTSSTLALTMKN